MKSRPLYEGKYLPLAGFLTRGTQTAAIAATQDSGGLLLQVKLALQDRSYLCLHAGFFTYGFHVAFLVTHLPGEVALCGHAATVSAASIGLIGLFNIAGSLCAGALGLDVVWKNRCERGVSVDFQDRQQFLARKEQTQEELINAIWWQNKEKPRQGLCQ